MSEMIDDFTSTCLKVIKTPANFFIQMPAKVGYADPVKFAVVCYLIAGMASSIIIFAAQFLFASQGPSNLGFIYITAVIPIIGVVGLFIGSLIFHIFFKILGGKSTYEGTLRILAYTSIVPAVFYLNLSVPIFAGRYVTSEYMPVFVAIVYLIPFTAIFLGLYILYLGMIGGIKVHKISILNSLIATVASTFISIFIISIIAILLYATINGGLLNNINEAISVVIGIVILMLIVILLDAKKMKQDNNRTLEDGRNNIMIKK